MKKNIDQITEEIKAWAEEEGNERAFIIFALDEIKDGEFSCSAGVHGRNSLIVDALSGAIEDEKNPVGNVIKSAIKFSAMKVISKHMAEASAEEGEEPSEAKPKSKKRSKKEYVS